MDFARPTARGPARWEPDDPPGPADELLALCDAQGRPLATARPRGVIHRDGLWHCSFHCWVVQAAPRGAALVLQRRAPTKATWPGAWDVSAAGHYRPGEGLAGGLREIEEELGLRVSAAELVPLERHREVLRYPTGLRDREYQDVYLVRRDEPLRAYRPDPREVTGLVALPAAAVAALARGALGHLVGRGWVLGADGWSEQRVRVPRARLVTRAGRYYERLARAARRLA